MSGKTFYGLLVHGGVYWCTQVAHQRSWYGPRAGRWTFHRNRQALRAAAERYTGARLGV